jgi:PKD repeat protein
VAKTSPGLWITRLVWVFGDGALMDIPYCCQNEVSEVQYHAYSQPGTYQVSVVAFDNAGNSGNALVNVNWVTPVPEYTTYGVPLIVSLLVTIFGIAQIRKASRH